MKILHSTANKMKAPTLLHKGYQIALLLLICCFYTTIYAQCPPNFSVNGAIESTGPITIQDVGNCPPQPGMIQWNSTNMQFEGYYGTSAGWQALSSSSSPHLWSYSSSPDIYPANSGKVGIGLTTTPVSKLHVSDLNLANDAAAAHIGYSSTIPSAGAIGLRIQGSQLTGMKGARSGIQSRVSADYLQKGNAFGALTGASSWFAGGSFYGVYGSAGSTNINTYNATTRSSILGGSFHLADTTNVTLDNGIYWIGGSYSRLAGTINNTPVTGAVAAVIGIDEQVGTSQSWAGYFEGKGHFSDKVAIGTKTIPTLSGTIDVSNYKLFVKGGILTENLTLNNCINWADYVFEEGYDLKSLEEVEAFIHAAGHLPNTPTAAEIAENGLVVKDVIMMQQEKIEELFLHAITLKKEKVALENRVATMEQRLLALENK